MKCKLCKENKSIKDFITNYKTCRECMLHTNRLIATHGYTLEDAKEKVSYGLDVDGKIRYWSMRYNKEKKRIIDER